MRIQPSHCNLYLAIALTVASLIALLINLYFYHYPGNNYFPPFTIYIGGTLFLMYVGTILQFSQHNRLPLVLKEVIYFFIVMAIVALATTAVQFTPFTPIDHTIVAFESQLGIEIPTILNWTAAHPNFNELLAWVYDTLPMQMTCLPLLVIIMRKTTRIRDYYFLLLMSGLIGFTFYYFFPTLAPANAIPSPLFGELQKATGLKFMQIHHFIRPTTLEGGMVAMPSFHVIWAWLCVYLVRDWVFVLIIVLSLNILLVFSCVLLGWHYPLDLLGSIIVLFLSHLLFHLCQRGSDRRLGARI